MDGRMKVGVMMLCGGVLSSWFFSRFRCGWLMATSLIYSIELNVSHVGLKELEHAYNSLSEHGSHVYHPIPSQNVPPAVIQ